MKHLHLAKVLFLLCCGVDHYNLRPTVCDSDFTFNINININLLKRIQVPLCELHWLMVEFDPERMVELDSKLMVEFDPGRMVELDSKLMVESDPWQMV